MLMGGFSLMGRTTACVVLLFQDWVLDTKLKFGLACFGIFAMGFAIEIIIALRRSLAKRINLFGEVWGVKETSYSYQLLLSFYRNFSPGNYLLLLKLNYRILSYTVHATVG